MSTAPNLTPKPPQIPKKIKKWNPLNDYQMRLNYLKQRHEIVCQRSIKEQPQDVIDPVPSIFVNTCDYEQLIPYNPREEELKPIAQKTAKIIINNKCIKCRKTLNKQLLPLLKKDQAVIEELEKDGFLSPRTERQFKRARNDLLNRRINIEITDKLDHDWNLTKVTHKQLNKLKRRSPKERQIKMDNQ